MIDTTTTTGADAERREDDAAFVERMERACVPPARTMLVSTAYWQRLITLARRAVSIPHTPHIVERNSGYSEFVLERTRPSRWSEDIPGCSILLTIDGGDFNGVRWPTRQLGKVSQPDTAPEPVGWFWYNFGSRRWEEGANRGWAQYWADRDGDGRVLGLYAAPPAPVPPAEVVELLQRYRSALVNKWGEAYGFTGHAAEIAAIDAALTAAQPSADHWCTCIPPIQAADDLSLCDRCRRKLIVRVDAGEVTEAAREFVEFWESHLIDGKSVRGDTAMRRLRAALAARGGRP